MNPSQSQWTTTISCKSHIHNKTTKPIHKKKKPSVLQVDIAAVVVKSFTFTYVCSVQMKALNHFVKGELISFPIFEKIPISMSTLGRL